MIVVIDAYNAIRFFEKIQGERNVRENVKTTFIARMQAYAFARRSTLHEVVVVFDGGDFRWAYKEQKRGVTLVHAGYGTSADDWILEYVGGKKAHEYVLVTDDRALGAAAGNNGVFVLGVEVFFEYVQTALRSSHPIKASRKKEELIQYASDEDEFENSNNLYLRELMEASTQDIMVKKVDNVEDGFRTESRAGKSQTSSKAELCIRRIVKKL